MMSRTFFVHNIKIFAEKIVFLGRKSVNVHFSATTQRKAVRISITLNLDKQQ